MSQKRPQAITASELAKRERRITEIARKLGFVGRIEYRHEGSQSGGAQYGLARVAEDDLLTVYAKAFDRDADPEEYSLESMIAHERGHQLIARTERLRRILPTTWSEAAEEVLASLLGSLLVDSSEDERNLILKAMFESVKLGNDLETVQNHHEELRDMLRRLK